MSLPKRANPKRVIKLPFPLNFLMCLSMDDHKCSVLTILTLRAPRADEECYFLFAPGLQWLRASWRLAIASARKTAKKWASSFWWGPGKPSLMQVRLLMLSTPSADKKTGTQNLNLPSSPNCPTMRAEQDN